MAGAPPACGPGRSASLMLPPELSLEITTIPATGRPARAEMLFVHGAYTDNWCWQPFFGPWFAARGFTVHLLSLRGHGSSGGRPLLFATSLDDYVTDVQTAISSLGSKPVLIGHSMGAAVVERAARLCGARGLALLAPIPPGGLLGVAHRLLFEQPASWAEFQRLAAGTASPTELEALRPFYFTEQIDPALLWETARRLQPESQRALLDLSFRFDRERGPLAMPVTVIGGGADGLFTPGQIAATAADYGVEATILAGVPHMLMLDHWEPVAQSLHAWLESYIPA